MRETRLSGSEGGGSGLSHPPYPYQNLPWPRKIKNTRNYCFFYGTNPIAIENKQLAKKRTQSNPIFQKTNEI